MTDTTHIQSAFLSYVQPGDRVFRGLDTDFRGAEERPETAFPAGVLASAPQLDDIFATRQLGPWIDRNVKGQPLVNDLAKVRVTKDQQRDMVFEALRLCSVLCTDGMAAASTIATIAPNHCCCWAVVDMRTVVNTRKEA